jgi:hypothetical protein
MRTLAAIMSHFRGATLLLLALCLHACLHAQVPGPDTLALRDEVLSTRLQDPLDFPMGSDSGSYTFLAGGHWYGAHENVHSKHPAASLYAGIDRINAQRPDWIFILGDVVRSASDPLQLSAFQDLEQQLVGQHQIVPGNHDLYQERHYHPRLGKLSDYGIIEGHPHVFLNTESLRFGGGRAMLQLLDGIGHKIGGNKSPHLFVFSHRLLWALAEPGFQEMDDFANQPFAPAVSADTVRLVYDAVLRLAGDRTLHWFSGDVGASWSETAFHDQSADGKRHFYAAGLGDCGDDGLWHVHVSPAGHVSARFLLLNGADAHGDDYYTLAQWRTRMQARQGIGSSSLGKRIQQLLGVPKFWVGLGVGFLLALGVGYFWRRRGRV